MKKILLCVFFLSCTLFACSDKNDDMNNEFSKGATKISVTTDDALTNLPYTGANLKVSVLSDGDWHIDNTTSWISFNPTGGIKNQPTTINITVKENTGMDSREGSLIIKSGNKSEAITITQLAGESISVSSSNLTCGGSEASFTVTVTANTSWQATSESSWLTVSPATGGNGVSEMTIKVAANSDQADRSSEIKISGTEASTTITVNQMADIINIPDGYALVWHDEFNGEALSNDWTLETQPSGWVNNELQNYVKTPVDGKNTVEVNNGILNINCFKGSDGKIYSGRMYANVKTGWTYGYFEASINLPSGKGTWPAFWMMPVNFKTWPDDGEMDIMEEVGVTPNEVSSSLHAKGHYHVENTQVTAARKLDGAEGNFHIYAMEWTPEKITTFVDGQKLLEYNNDGSGDLNWPYHTPFYVILNLAWGGDWGGMQGTDDTALPVTMKVDYVRVFQKP